MGYSGQMLLHQPLFPLNSTPPRKAPASSSTISTALAVPLLLNSHLRLEAARKKTLKPMTKPYSFHQLGGLRARLKLKRRGAWLKAASGQALRQMPGAIRKSSGSSGTVSRQKTSRPFCGSSSSSAAIPNARATLSRRAASHQRAGSRERSRNCK